MKSYIKNTSSGSQFPIWFSERAKIQGILTSLEKSQLYDLETKIKKAFWAWGLPAGSRTQVSPSRNSASLAAEAPPEAQ